MNFEPSRPVDLAQRADRALGAYLGLAIGDALGATVEFLRPREIQNQYGIHRDIIGGGWLKLARGQVTDDTTMSLALGDALVAGGPAALRRCLDGDDTLVRDIGHAYVRWWRGKPVDCGNTCRRGIQRFVRDGSLEGPLSDGDGGNGALMRNLPAALATLGQPAALARLSVAQAHLTHHHPLSDVATVDLGALTQALVLGWGATERTAWVADWVATHRVFSYAPYPGRASGYVVDTVQTVLHSLSVGADFEQAVITAVNQGDDADTTGALVGMLAGAECGASALPARWVQRLQADTVRAITQQTHALLALADAWPALPVLGPLAQSAPLVGASLPTDAPSAV